MKIWLMLFCLAVGLAAWAAIATYRGQHLEIRTVNAPNPAQDAEIKDLKARVKAVEEWQERQGRRYK